MGKTEIDKHRYELRAVSNILATIDYKRVILTDRPDIIVETKDGKCIGIEVTDCIISSIRSKDKHNRVRVAKNIAEVKDAYKKILIDRGELHISVELTFSGNILNAPQKGFTQKIIEEIERHRKNDWMITDFYRNVEDVEFREEYERVANDGGFHYDFVESVKCFEHPLIETSVSDFSIFFSDYMQDDDFDERLKEKNKKLEEYKRLSSNAQIDEYWLVINVPTAEHFTFDDDYQYTKDMQTEYNRVYISYPFDGCKRLK